MTTVAQALTSAIDGLAGAGIDDARLEAEVLLAFATRIDRARLLARLADAIDDETARDFDALLNRRVSAHEPLAYITGAREFYGLEMICAPGALIPRPETEMLVDVALAELGSRPDDLRIIDVGTGTGAVAIAIAKCAPRARVTAIDSSPCALTIARANARRHDLAHRIEFCEGDLLEGAGTYDVVLANLPYVSEAEWEALPSHIKDHEPREALVPGPRGTEAIARLLRSVPSHLASAGVVAVEIGAAQAKVLFEIARSSFPTAEVCVKKDLAGLDRLLTVRNGRMG